MTYDGYLAFGGNEVVNSERARGYSQTADCPMFWLKGDPCAGLPYAVGDSVYNYFDITQAPWYDSTIDDISRRFYGVYGLEVSGVEDSTRTAPVIEGIGDGGVIGRSRRAVRNVKVRALLLGKGQDAVEYGMSWMNSMLDPDACGQISEDCGTATASMFSSCPPERGIVDYYSEWEETDRNLFPNPSFESTSSMTVINRNLLPNPSFEAASGTVEVMRNLAINPTTAGAAGYQSNNAATWTVTKETSSTTTNPQDINTRMRSVLNGAQSTPSVMSMYNVDGLSNVNPDRLLGAWFYVNTSGYEAWLGAGSSTVRTPLPSSQWTWVTGSASANSFAGAFVQKIAPGAVAAPSDIAYITGVTATQGYTPQATIAGGVPFPTLAAPDPDLTVSWVGTANASESSVTGVLVSNVNPTSSAQSLRAYQTSDRPRHRGKAARFRTIISSAIAIPVSDFVPVPGETYTIILSVRSNGRSERVYPRIGGAASPEITDLPADRWVQLRATLTASTGGALSTGLYVSADPTRPYGSTIDIDEAVLVPGIYTGGYFDGASPDRLRVNRVLNPGPRSISGWGAIGATTDFSSGHLVATSTYAGAAATVPRAQVVNKSGSIPVHGLDPYYLRVEVIHSRGLPMEIRPWFLDAQGNYLVYHISPTATDTSEWTAIETTGIVPAGAAYMGYQVIVKSSSDLSLIGDVFEARNITTDPGEYFDGESEMPSGFDASWEGTPNFSLSYVYDSDFMYAWFGTEDASLTTQMVYTVRGVSSNTACWAIRSTRWKKDGEYSLRLIPRGESNVTYTTLAIPAGPVRDVGTVQATSYQEAPLTGDLWASRGRPYVLNPTQSASVATPNQAGEYRHRIVFSGLTSQFSFLLPHGGSAGSGDVWWDSAILSEGIYEDGYFDGSTVPEDPELEQYRWLGEVNDSESVRETRQALQRPQTDEEYAIDLDFTRRYMRNAGAISGPFKIGEMQSNGFWAYEVQFVLAGGPSILGVTKALQLAPTTPEVIQDIPYNLIPYPSAELLDETPITIMTNFSTNPSLESNDTGWSVVPDGVNITAGMVSGGRVSGELSAAGPTSYRAVFAAVGAGSNGYFGVQQEVSLSGSPSGSRVSFNYWAAELVMSGTMVRPDIEIVAYWRSTSGGAVLRTDVLGTVPVNGGALSVSSVLPPAGANFVLVRAQAKVTSWTAGSILRLYADALAVTIP